MEPHINTLDMETVLTLRKQTPRFVVLEFRQADGALQNRLLLKQRCLIRFRRINKYGEGVEDGGVEAAGGAGGEGSGVLMKDDVGAAVSVVAAEMAAAGAMKVPAGVEVEADHEDDDEKEDDYGAEHNLAAEGVSLRGVGAVLIGLRAVGVELLGLRAVGVELLGLQAAAHGWSTGKVYDG